MTAPVDLIASLDATFDHARGVIAAVRADQHDDPTPCSEWTVRDLLDHTIAVVAGVGAAVAGEKPKPFELGIDPAGEFDEAATATMAAWRRPGVLDQAIEFGPGTMPGRVVAGINLLDTATHSWDLAKATGQSTDLPADVAEAALEVSRKIVNPQLREGRFAPEQPTPDNANATERLVRFLGRTP